jgi:hypothetical protein
VFVKTADFGPLLNSFLGEQLAPIRSQGRRGHKDGRSDLSQSEDEVGSVLSAKSRSVEGEVQTGQEGIEVIETATRQASGQP